jgi:hypothetical protein
MLLALLCKADYVAVCTQGNDMIGICVTGEHIQRVFTD